MAGRDADYFGLGSHGNLSGGDAATEAALQQMLQQLGLDFRQAMAGQQTQLRSFLAGLKDKSPGKQLSSLVELCETLSMGSEDTMSTSLAEEFVPELVSLLKSGANDEIMLSACRALVYLMEIMPTSSSIVVEHGTIPVLCSKLMVIEVIDLAEESLLAIEKLSRRNGDALLKEGGLSAVLTFLDFFAMAAQRSALTSAANMCVKVTRTEECFDIVKPVINTLRELVASPDGKIADKACVCCMSLVDVFQTDSDKLEAIAGDTLVPNLLKIMGHSRESASTLTNVIHTLSQLCQGSPKLTSSCFTQNVPKMVYEFVVDSTLTPSLPLTPTLTPTLTPRPTHTPTPTQTPNVSSSTLLGVSGGVVLRTQPHKQVEEFFVLLCNMLPKLPSTPLYSNLDTIGSQGGHEKGQVECGLYNPYELARTWLPVLVEVYVSMCNIALQDSCLSLIMKLLMCVCEEDVASGGNGVHVSDSDLADCVRAVSASFICSLLKSSQGCPTMFGVAIATTMVERLPTYYSSTFLREGVMHEMQQLRVESTSISTSTAQSKSTTKVTSSSPTSEKGDTLLNGSVKQKLWIQRYAEEFITILQSDEASSSLLSEQSVTVAAMAKLVDFLNNPHEDGPDALQMLSTIVAETSTPLSAYEVTNCGLVPALLCYLSTPNLTDRLVRLRSFVSIFLQPKPHKHTTTTTTTTSFDGDINMVSDADVVCGDEVNDSRELYTTNDDPPMKSLLNVLHEVLGRVENFPLQIHNVLAEDGSPSSFSSHLKVLTRPVRIRLERAPNQVGKVKDLNKIVAVEPLASLSAIEDFLWPEVKPSSMERPDDASTSTEKMAGELAAAAHALEKLHYPGQEVDDVTTSSAEDNEADPSDYTETDGLDSDNTKSEEKEDATSNEHVLPTDSTSTETVEKTRKSKKSQSSRKSKKEKKDSESELDFFVNGEKLCHTVTVLHCLQKYTDFSSDVHKVPGTSQICNRSSSQWPSSNSLSDDKELVITYARRVDPNTSTPASTSKSAITSGSQSYNTNNSTAISTISRKRALSLDGIRVHSPEDQFLHVFNSILEWEDRSEFGYTPSHTGIKTKDVDVRECVLDITTFNVLRMLKLLHTVNTRWFLLYNRQQAAVLSNTIVPLSDTNFINKKVNAKINRQLLDPLTLASSSVPEWCGTLCHTCGFLLPWETRQAFLHATTFGIARALTDLQKQTEQSGGTQKAELRIARIQRAKVQINRNQMLEACMKLMSKYASSHLMLEIEYKNEVGTGLGPTLEFYTLVSREYQSAALGLWRERIQGIGLYPAPLPTDDKAARKRCSMFKSLGQFVGKALWDSKIIDIPFSLTFLRWLLIEEDQFRLSSFEDIDPTLCRQLTSMDELRVAYDVIETNEALTDKQKEEEVDKLKLNGVSIDDLCLDFTVPGYPDIELFPGGAETSVTIHTLAQYLRLVERMILLDGVREQMCAFREGFNEVIPLSALRGFTPNELSLMMFGAEEEWDIDTLAAHTKPDHGYTTNSPAVKNLFNILSKYDQAEKGKFLQFITGSPRLPVGGIKSLQPPLTIVRKVPDDAMGPDDFLPSVMTCTNYLKLPDYSTLEVMADRLVTAMNEGTGSFHMS
eukprot:CFRG2053T1